MRFTQRASMPALRTTTPFLGAGGGVGTSTLCSWLGDDATDCRLAAPEWTGTPIVVVTRGTSASTAAAARLVAGLTGSAVAVRVVLAVVADAAAPEPGVVRSRLRSLRASVTGVVRIPYVESWRYLDDPLTQPLPRAYGRSLRALIHLVNRT